MVSSEPMILTADLAAQLFVEGFAGGLLTYLAARLGMDTARDLYARFWNWRAECAGPQQGLSSVGPEAQHWPSRQ